MKNPKAALLVGASVVTIGAAGLGASASAQSGYGSSGDSGTKTNNWSWSWHWNNERDSNFDADLSAAIAAKYNVDKAEATALVETVRDDQFNVLNDDRQATLDAALKDEKITNEQYDTIIGHLTNIDKAYDKIDDSSGKERRDLWKEIKSEFKELKSYLDDEGISINLDLDMSNSNKSHDHDRTKKGDKSQR